MEITRTEEDPCGIQYPEDRSGSSFLFISELTDGQKVLSNDGHVWG